jgi:hypothetical protein
MRSARIFTLGLIATTLTLVVGTSCKKSNTSNSNNAISATISGTGFAPSITAMFYSTDSALFEFSGATFKTGDTSGLILAISTSSPFAINKAITDPNYVLLDYTHNDKDYWNGYTPGHFAVTITSWDSVNHKVVGNFTGTLYSDWGSKDSVVITNGNFNTSYIVQP